MSNKIPILNKIENRLRGAGILCPKLLSIGTTPADHTDKVKIVLTDHILPKDVLIDHTDRVKIQEAEIITAIIPDHTKAVKAVKTVLAIRLVKAVKTVLVIKAVKAVKTVLAIKAVKVVRDVPITKADQVLKGATEVIKGVRVLIETEDLLSKIGITALTEQVAAIIASHITVLGNVRKVATIRDRVKAKIASAVLNRWKRQCLLALIVLMPGKKWVRGVRILASTKSVKSSRVLMPQGIADLTAVQML